MLVAMGDRGDCGDLVSIRGWITCILQISPTGNAQLDIAAVHAGTGNVHQLAVPKNVVALHFFGEGRCL